MALIMVSWLDAVVAVGSKPLKENEPPNWTATGFFVSYKAENSEDRHPFLITNKHVVRGIYEKLNSEKIYVRYKPREQELRKIIELKLLKTDGSPFWVEHPDPKIDVAVMRFPWGDLEERKLGAWCYVAET